MINTNNSMMTAFTLNQNDSPIISSQNGGKFGGGKTEKKNHNNNNNKNKMHPLPLDFTPRTNDVICAKGNDAKEHIGNIKFRYMINQFSEEYGKATSRHQKTAIVNQIMDTIHNANGTFIRYNNDNEADGCACWYEVSEPLAREKIGQRLREKNHSMYKSSTKSKRKFRKDLNQKAIDQISTIVKTNESVSAALHELSTFLENYNSNSNSNSKNNTQNQLQQTMIPVQPQQHQQQQQQTDAASLSSSSSCSFDDDDKSEGSTTNMSDIELELAMTKANSQILASLKDDKSIQTMLEGGDE